MHRRYIVRRCLILPDVRDYDRLGKDFQTLNIRKKDEIRDSKLTTKIHEIACQLPTSRYSDIHSSLCVPSCLPIAAT